MNHHTAHNLSLGALDIMVVDDSKPMQGIYRSIFSGMGIKRYRIYSGAERAMNAMLSEPPNVLITDWRMEPTSGGKFIRTLRLKQMDPLCFLPIIVVSAFATRSVVEQAYRIGANSFLLKPLSPEALMKRLIWLTDDARTFQLTSDRYVIDGVEDRLRDHRDRADRLNKARVYHQEKLSSPVAELQNQVRELMQDTTPVMLKDTSPLREKLLERQAKRKKTAGFAGIGSKK